MRYTCVRQVAAGKGTAPTVTRSVRFSVTAGSFVVLLLALTLGRLVTSAAPAETTSDAMQAPPFATAGLATLGEPPPPAPTAALTATPPAAFTATPPPPTATATLTPTATLAPTPTATPTPPPIATPTPTPSPQGPAVPILMYHYIRPDPGPGDPVGQDLSVTPQDFAAQMDWLAANGFTPVTLAELADARSGASELPANPVVLTFDDGYRDFYTNAWPVLQAHHFKAVTFIITGVVGDEQYMTWDMLAELDRSGLIEVASHTVTHRDLPQISDDDAAHELADSKAALEQFLGHPVRSFSYPSGHYTDRDVANARADGYTMAVTTAGGWAAPDADPLQLPRVRIHGFTSLDQFAAYLS
jgi:peptidoglycan/xylan/chitin deacetylase (PgdA/CDA1 family)